MLLLVASMALTGANVPVAKALVATLPADALLVLRFAIASAVLVPIAACEAGPRLSSLGPRQWGAVFVLAAAGSVLFTWFILEGVQRTSGASAGIITASLPAAVVLLGLVIGHRPRPAELSMVVLAVGGVLLVVGEGHVTGGGTGDGGRVGDAATGSALIGLAVLCEATFVIVARGISRRLGPLRLSLAVALVGLAICLPFGIPALMRIEAAAVPAHIWALVAWHTLTASVLCTALWYRGIGHVEPWAAGLATAAVPIAALAVSAIGLGETITTRQAAGACLVVIAIAIGTLASRRSRGT